MTIGLRARLLFPSALITIALLASVSYDAMSRTQSALLAADDSRLRELVTQIAIASEFGVEWNMASDLPPRLADLVDAPAVRWIVVHGRAGRPLLVAHSGGIRPHDLTGRWFGPFPRDVEVVPGGDLGLPESIREYRAPVVRHAPHASREPEEVRPPAGDLGPLELEALPPETEAPVPAGHSTNEPIGVVRVGMTQDRSRSEARGIALQIGLVALGIALFGTFLLWMAGRAIARPILRLVEDTQTLAEGHFRHRTVVPRTLEIAALARAFNRMGERLETYHQQVLEHNQTLERKVEERTAELTRAMEELKRLDRLKDEFLSNVSHEFRTPLTSIRSYGEILRDYGDEDPKVRGEFLGIIVAESERLTRLIEETLDLSKIRSGTAVWRADLVDLTTSIREVFARLEPVAAKARVTLELVEQDADVHVIADSDRLIQIWTNLIGNAIKFSPPHSTVGVVVRREGQDAKVDVLDDGPGIPKEDHARIFEQFGQSGDLMTKKPMGTGLGLTIAREIVEHFGGSVSVASTFGEGSTFTVSLPEASRRRETVGSLDS